MGGGTRTFFPGAFGSWEVELEAGARERNKAGGECGVLWATHPPLVQLPGGPPSWPRGPDGQT